MKRYQKPEVYEALAAEYVLGTLTGPARRRFVQLMEERAYIRHAVEVLEQRLHPLVEDLPPTEPPPHVWHAVQRDLPEVRKPPGIGWLASLGFWRTATFASLALVLVLGGVWLVRPPAGGATPAFVVVLNSQDHKPMIVATADHKTNMLTVKMMHKPKMPEDEDMQLWCIMKNTKKAVSMAVLSRGQESRIHLTRADWQALDHTAELAVSMEPRGGSPTGQPTGKVMYQGTVISML
ncbi:MAG: anti-sigma factor [Gammaproteobacteria bacterium]|jgi:anti-sigma-K factor RskA